MKKKITITTSIALFLSTLNTSAHAASLLNVCGRIIHKQTLSDKIGYKHPMGDRDNFTLGTSGIGIRRDDRYSGSKNSSNKYIKIEAKWLEDEKWTSCTLSTGQKRGLVTCDGMFTTNGSGSSNGYTSTRKILDNEGPVIDEGIQRLRITSQKDPNTSVYATQVYAELAECSLDPKREPINPPYGENSPLPNMKKLPINIKWTAVYEIEEFKKEFQIMYSYNGYTIPFSPKPKGF